MHFILSSAEKTTEIKTLARQLKENAEDLELLFQMASNKHCKASLPKCSKFFYTSSVKTTYGLTVLPVYARGLFIMLGKQNPVVIEYRQKLINQM